MSRKNEVASVNGEIAMSENLAGLVDLVGRSVEHYQKQAVKLRELDESLLNDLSKQEMLDVMDIDTKIKLMANVQKQSIAPIEALTKLVQTMLSLQERQEMTSSTQELRELIEEVKNAKDSAQPKNLGTIEAEIS